MSTMTSTASTGNSPGHGESGESGDCSDQKGVVTFGSLCRQHNAISSIKHSIGNIGGFCACWRRCLDHGLQHLCRCDHELAIMIGFTNHHLLSQAYLINGNLQSQVASCNHYAISHLGDIIEVV